MSWPMIMASLAIVTLGGGLSVIVVLKRLAFIGQGVSHAAFGGVGIALVCGLSGATLASSIGLNAVIVAFSIAAAIWIASLSKRSAGGSDTAIGVVLAVSMAVGFILVQIASERFEQAHAGHDHSHASMAHHEDAHHAIEEVLFGNILSVKPTAAIVALIASIVILAVAWIMRRKLIFWAFDESVCDSFGVRTDRVQRSFLIMLALSIVVAMQMAGVVLASAIFVLPGAAALNLTDKLRPAFAASVSIALIGASAGMLLGDAISWPIGPCIVGIQGALYAISFACGRVLK